MSLAANRLTREQSPYLLQHSANPVDWYPWGEEAFARARQENKPIFLSIGYSTCHWCHVMAHESFEDPAVAEILNAHFVPVKVDREERPEVDAIYMSAVMAMTGQGGWPLSVFLTPELKPFFGGTYFPPQPRHGLPGFRQVLEAVHQRWTNNSREMTEASEMLIKALSGETASVHTAGDLGEDVLARAYHELSATFDRQYGGFGQAPKFPMGQVVSFLLRFWRRTGQPHALVMVERTLQGMAAGGIRDFLGGGFHRYSTDERWQVPHFEKMLYDQSWLARAYLEAYQATGKARYADVAREILDYVLRDLWDPAGGFYCAEDADSADSSAQNGESGHKKEGAFYLWGFEEIQLLLNPDELRVAQEYFDLRPEGNIFFDPHGEFSGKNVLAQAAGLDEKAQGLELASPELTSLLEQIRAKLFAARCLRPRPGRDDKILTDWNGMMIGALALASGALGEERYLASARCAADFILANLLSPDGRLTHVARKGQDGVAGNLGDYAFFIQGLLDLFEACGVEKYLTAAVRLGETMAVLFGDGNGGLFFSAANDANLVIRPKDRYDGAMPSAASAAALDFARLYHLTHDPLWQQRLSGVLSDFSQAVRQRPSGYTGLLAALDFYLGPVDEIVVVAADSAQAGVLRRDFFRRYLPAKALVITWDGSPVDPVAAVWHGKSAVGGQATMYWCRGQHCRAPVTGLESIREILRRELGEIPGNPVDKEKSPV